MRAPDSTRAKMSRPSSSRPNQCVADGPSRRRAQLLRSRIEARECRTDQRRQDGDEHDGRADSGHRPIQWSRRIGSMSISYSYRIRGSTRPYRRSVKRFIADVGHRDQQDAPLHERIVAESDRLNQQSADARPGEDRLGDDGAGQHRAELQADERDDRNQAVAERVTRSLPARATRRGHARRSRTARAVPRAAWRASSAPESRRARRPARPPAGPGSPSVPRPETGSHPSSIENTIASSGPSQKFGIEMPSERQRRRCVIDAVPRHTAAAMPSGMANATATIIAAAASSIVAGMRSRIGGRDRLVRCAASVRDRRAARRRESGRTARAAGGPDRAARAAPRRPAGDAALAEHRLRRIAGNQVNEREDQCRDAEQYRDRQRDAAREKPQHADLARSRTSALCLVLVRAEHILGDRHFVQRETGIRRARLRHWDCQAYSGRPRPAPFFRSWSIGGSRSGS